MDLIKNISAVMQNTSTVETSVAASTAIIFGLIYLAVAGGICALMIFVCYKIATSKGLSKNYMWLGFFGVIGILIVAIMPPQNQYPPYPPQYPQYPNQQYPNQYPNQYPQYPNQYPNNQYQNRPPYQQPNPQQQGGGVSLNKPICPHCGSILISDSQYCDNCGARLK